MDYEDHALIVETVLKWYNGEHNMTDESLLTWLREFIDGWEE